MARTQPRGSQILDGTIQRVDLDITTSGSAVIAKAIQGFAISLSSTGADAGTGDVTIGVNPAVDHAFTVAQSITLNPSSTNTVIEAFAFKRNTSSPAGAIGLGVGIGFYGESNTTVDRWQAYIRSYWTTATDASRTAALKLSAASAGADPDTMQGLKVFGDGGGRLGEPSDVSPGGGILSVLTGFRINNAATIGYYLRGDGTNFVEQAVQTGDLAIAVQGDLGFTANQSIILNNAETGGASGPFFTIGHNTSGTPAINLGTAIRFQTETDTTINTDCGMFQCQWSNVTHATRASYFDFKLCSSGIPATKMRLHGSGGLSVNATADPGAGIVNANSGFRIGNAAASGNVIRGNGTDFVSAVLAAGDLSTEPTTGNAAAGKLGEYIEADLLTGSATALTTNTAKTITSISLTAGDWDVSGVVHYKPAATTSVTKEQVGISKTNNTFELPYVDTIIHATIVYTAIDPACSKVTPLRRISISGNTTVYLVGLATFTVSTMTAYGHIQARRVR